MDNTSTSTPPAPQPDLAAVQRRYQMLLDRWHQAQPRSLRAEIIQVPSNQNGNIAIVRAIAETAEGTFDAFGSADALMAGSDRAVVLLEWAELLAKTSALRDACNAASLAFGMEPPPPVQPARNSPVYSTAVVENGRVMAGAIGQVLGSSARATNARGRSAAAMLSAPPAHTQQAGDRSPASVMSSFLSRLINRVQASSSAATTEELLHPEAILQNRQTVTLTVDTYALEKVSDTLLGMIAQHQANATIYTGVQRLSRLKTFELRYRALLEVVERIYVFGIEDTAIWTHPRLQVMPLKPSVTSSGLDRFWYIVCNDDQFRTALLAEQAATVATSSPGNAQYKGFWTFESPITKEAATILDQATTLLR